MIFTHLGLEGVSLIGLEPKLDERGFFARTWCQEEVTAAGLNPRVVQESLSYNRRRGTLRGMHFQRPPNEETKFVRCVRGAIYDVILDLRKESATYLEWRAIDLTAENRLALYIPGGVAHGFLTLADETEVFYQISEFHVPTAAAGYRYDDPAFQIKWPAPVEIISDKDLAWPRFER